MTLKLGVIGTNWITNMFVKAAHATGEYELTSVYSRREATGEAFASDFGGTATVYTDLNDMYGSGIDVVYIASPNSLHFAQTTVAIRNGIHVIVEKSAFSNTREFEEVYSLLREHPTVRFFEAVRHIQQPNFHAIQRQVEEMPVVAGATFVYEKYSSRFDDYLQGHEPNVLTREFSAGALTDLGVYPIYAAMRLFGMPKSRHYFATKLANGADVRGTVILRYEDFDVTVIFGKGSSSYLHSEILGRRDTILIDQIAELGEVTYRDEHGDDHVISSPAPENPMIMEAQLFAAIINDPEGNDDIYRDLLLLSQQVNLVLTDLRRDAEITFPADEV
jgi:predicted dehydrogenase